MIRRVAIAGGIAATLVAGTAAVAYWTIHNQPSMAAGTVAALPDGSAPQASAEGSTVTVRWPATEIRPGAPVAGYRVTRYGADKVGHPAGNGCSGIITALTCVETGVAEGVSTYTVRPVQGTNWVGTESRPSAPVTVKTLTIAAPAAGATYGLGSFHGACGPAADICGKAQPAGGATLTDVKVSVRHAGGRYWSGTGFTATAENLVPAGAVSGWSLPFPVRNFTDSGEYVVHVVTADSSGRTADASSRFTVLVDEPKIPVFTGKPAEHTNRTAATFTFKAGDPTGAPVTFRCALDRGTFAPCTSPYAIPGALGAGEHTFLVHAVDAGGNVGDDATYRWTVDTTAPTAAGVQAENTTFGAAGTAGIIGSGDRLILSYSEAMDRRSLVSGWTSDGPLRVTLRITRGPAGGADQINVYDAANTVRYPVLGTISLGQAGYVTADTTVPATVTTADGGATLVFTLGDPANATAGATTLPAGTVPTGTLPTAMPAGAMTWTPGGGTDLAGNPLANAGATVTESGTPADVDF